MTYASPTLLDRRHNVALFDCGEPALNGWLQRHALTAQASDSARVFVTTLSGTDEVVGYYALATAAVEPSDAPTRVAKGQPAARSIPAVLLARFAVDLAHQRRGVGQSLLQDVLVRCVQAAENVGIRVLLVHAKNDRARDWYLRFDFEQSPTDPLHLLMLMKDIRKTLNEFGA